MFPYSRFAFPYSRFAAQAAFSALRAPPSFSGSLLSLPRLGLLQWEKGDHLWWMRCPMYKALQLLIRHSQTSFRTTPSLTREGLYYSSLCEVESSCVSVLAVCVSVLAFCCASCFFSSKSSAIILWLSALSASIFAFSAFISSICSFL